MQIKSTAYAVFFLAFLDIVSFLSYNSGSIKFFKIGGFIYPDER